MSDTVTGMDQLTAMDRCDRCGAQAYLRVRLASGSELLFCTHHKNEHKDALEQLCEAGAEIYDETRLLEVRP